MKEHNKVKFDLILREKFPEGVPTLKPSPGPSAESSKKLQKKPPAPLHNTLFLCMILCLDTMPDSKNWEKSLTDHTKMFDFMKVKSFICNIKKRLQFNLKN